MTRLSKAIRAMLVAAAVVAASVLATSAQTDNARPAVFELAGAQDARDWTFAFLGGPGKTLPVKGPVEGPREPMVFEVKLDPRCRDFPESLSAVGARP